MLAIPTGPFSTGALDRIRSGSFYGQTHISLPDVEKRLEKTAETIGSPDEIRAFVFSGLSRFGCRWEENDDGSYRLAVTHPSLQAAADGDGAPSSILKELVPVGLPIYGEGTLPRETACGRVRPADVNRR